MNNKFKKNILFLIIFIFLFVIVALFNYTIDPYNLFRNKNLTRLISLPPEFVNIYIKMHKNVKTDRIIIGSSECDLIVSTSLFGKFHKLTLRGIEHKQYYDFLKAHFDLHPEVKDVVIVLTYTDITGYFKPTIPVYTGEKLNINEIIKLFFSYQITKASVEKIKEKFFYEKKEDANSSIEYHSCFPKQFEVPKKIGKLEEYTNQENIEYLGKIIAFLKEKKVNYYFIIPPYNAIYLSFIKNIEEYNEQVKAIKKYVVSKDVVLYDFAFVNKHTEKSLFDFPYLNRNFNHPSFLWGNKIYKTLFLDRSNNDGLYMLLTKDNVDEMLKLQDELLEKYKKNNSEIVNLYNEIAQKTNSPAGNKELEFDITYTTNDIPTEYQEWLEE